MSRFKLFSLFQIMAAVISGNQKFTSDEKVAELKSLNRKSGGILFGGGSPYGGRQLNQRQKRKRAAQNR